MNHCLNPAPDRTLDTRSAVAYTIAVTAAIVLFVILFALLVSRNPLRMDEVDFFQSMQNVIRFGLPLYYAGEVNLSPNSLMHLSTRVLAGRQFEFYRFKPETGILKETFFALADGHSRYTYGLWHPPLYIYAGALFLWAFPLSPENSGLLRYFNLVFCIGIFAGMAALSRQLYPDHFRSVFALSLILFALNNLAVRGSLLIDYNGALGPCVATWFALAYLRSEDRNAFHAGLAGITAAALFTGLGIAASLFGGVLVYVVVWGRGRNPWRSIASIAAGVGFFLVAFWAICRLLNLPFSQPFLHNFQRAGIRLTANWLAMQASSALTYAAWYSREVGFWIILLSLGLWIKAIVVREASKSASRNLLPVLVFVGFLLQGSLRADAYGFPKYVIFLLPLLFVYLAGQLMSTLAESGTSRWAARGLLTVALAVIILSEGWIWFGTLQKSGGTLYLPGEKGISEIARTVKSQSEPDEVILGPRDVAFFAGRRFVQWSGSVLTDAAQLRRWVDVASIRHLVSATGMLSLVSPDVADYLQHHFNTQSQQGDFSLLFLNSTPAPAGH
jgi:hypothetical protein